MNIKELKEAARQSEAEDGNPNTKVYDNFRYLANPSTILSLIASHDALVEALKGLVLCMDLFRASDGNQADAYYLFAKQDAVWDTARAALETPANPIEEVVDEPSRKD